MDYIVRPKIRVRGAGQAAAAGEAPQDRLLKYIPLSIAGAYPLLENGIAEYIKNPSGNLSANWIEWTVFALLIVWYIIFLHSKYSKTAYVGWIRYRLQASQTTISIIAFCIWTYSLKSAIWIDIYNAGLALIATILFVLFASLYTPTVTTD